VLSVSPLLPPDFLSKTLSQTREGQVHVVMGNQACDLDSTVSAITLAYLRSLQDVDSATIWYPLIPIPSREVKLRTEVTYLFCEVGLEINLMSCLETFPFEKVWTRSETN
jgi:exopolyphosphatase